MNAIFRDAVRRTFSHALSCWHSTGRRPARLFFAPVGVLEENRRTAEVGHSREDGCREYDPAARARNFPFRVMTRSPRPSPRVGATAFEHPCARPSCAVFCFTACFSEAAISAILPGVSGAILSLSITARLRVTSGTAHLSRAYSQPRTTLPPAPPSEVDEFSLVETLQLDSRADGRLVPDKTQTKSSPPTCPSREPDGRTSKPSRRMEAVRLISSSPFRKPCRSLYSLKRQDRRRSAYTIPPAALPRSSSECACCRAAR